MAKNRRIPFGYQMINGEITTHPREVYAISKIFAEYLKGRSLLDSEIIQGLTGLKPSVGTVSNMLHSAAVKAKMIVDGFQQKLHENPVVHCD